MGEQRPQRLGAFILRLASTVAGALILKHEVYDAESAEAIVVALGLWLIGVPPALWLDALRRASKTLDSSLGEDTKPRGEGITKDGDEPPP